jgi:outer membrane protein OmpA-like peptidoglycan-associated protein
MLGVGKIGELGMFRTYALGLGAAALLVVGACTSTKRAESGAAASPCRDTTVTLYFATDSDVIPDEGGEIIKATAKQLNRCKVHEIELLGLADPTGAPQTNLDLSKRRADHVLDAFVHAGLGVPRYTLTAAGANGAVNSTGAVEPIRRRVDVTVKMER